MRRKLIVMLAAIGMLMAVAAPAGADPADGNGTKSISDEDRPFAVDCDGTDVQGVADGWVQVMPDGSQVGHIVYTYTHEDNTFTYVETYRDTNFLNQEGEPISSRRGRMFEGLIGFLAINEATTVVTTHGNAGELADDQACAALVG